MPLGRAFGIWHRAVHFCLLFRRVRRTKLAVRATDLHGQAHLWP